MFYLNSVLSVTDYGSIHMVINTWQDCDAMKFFQISVFVLHLFAPHSCLGLTYITCIILFGWEWPCSMLQLKHGCSFPYLNLLSPSSVEVWFLLDAYSRELPVCHFTPDIWFSTAQQVWWFHNQFTQPRSSFLVHRTRKSDRKCSARFFCLVLPVWYRTSGVLVLCLFAGQGYEKNNLLPVVWPRQIYLSLGWSVVTSQSRLSLDWDLLQQTTLDWDKSISVNHW